jgi:hypothetical protein
MGLDRVFWVIRSVDKGAKRPVLPDCRTQSGAHAGLPNKCIVKKTSSEDRTVSTFLPDSLCTMWDQRRVVPLEGLFEGRRDDVLGVAVHHVGVLPRLLGHAGPSCSEALVGHPSKQEGVGCGQLIILEPLLLLAAELRSSSGPQPPRPATRTPTRSPFSRDLLGSFASYTPTTNVGCTPGTRAPLTGWWGAGSRPRARPRARAGTFLRVDLSRIVLCAGAIPFPSGLVFSFLLCGFRFNVTGRPGSKALPFLLLPFARRLSPSEKELATHQVR